MIATEDEEYVPEKAVSGLNGWIDCFPTQNMHSWKLKSVGNTGFDMGTQGSLSVHREFTSKQQMLNSKNVEISMFSKKRKTPEIRSFLVDEDGGWSGARMRYYLISPIALSIEKKGVDAVRKVSVFRSVTLSVTFLIQINCGKNPDLMLGLPRRVCPTSFFWICLHFAVSILKSYCNQDFARLLR